MGCNKCISAVQGIKLSHNQESKMRLKLESCCHLVAFLVFDCIFPMDGV